MTDAILEALENLQKSEDDEKKPSYNEENPYFFCVDSFLTEDINVSVDNVGTLEFPLTEETVKKVVIQSVKAKFGKGEETILDTSIRDTQMIPGEKLKVEIKEEVLSALLLRIAKELNVDPDSRLIPHLYNMLIYERGHFFKEHKDSEKVNNMIATLVVLLPSPHEGGELIIKHKGKKGKFSGSVNHKIVQCVAFYPDCTHEVLKVRQGFRVSLTYNIELDFGNSPKLLPVDPDLEEGLSEYFADEDESKTNRKLVYYLNHLYSENSLNWSMLKGTDRTEALALFAAAKELGYLPSLALMEHHKSMNVGYGYYGDEEEEEGSSDTKLKMLVDENNIKYKLNKSFIPVDEDEACYSMETEDLIKPEKGPVEGFLGNEGQHRDYWYTRAAVVVFESEWSFPIGFRTQFKCLHDLTRGPGNEIELKKIFDENSDEFLDVELLNKAAAEDSNIMDMLMDVALYMNDKKRAVEIICKFSPDKTLKFVPIPKLMECFDKILEPASWIEILPVWKTNIHYYRKGSKEVKSVLQPYIWSHLEKNPNGYNVQVVEYLLSEIIDFINGSRMYYWQYEGSVTDNNFSDDLKYILQILDDLKNEHVEEKLSIKIRHKLSVQKVVKTNKDFSILKEMLTPKQYSRVANVLEEQVIDISLNDIEKCHKTTYTYFIDANGANIKKFCSFFLILMDIQDPELRITALNRMESKPHIYAGTFIISVIDKLENVNWSQNRDFLNLFLRIINKQLASSEGMTNWSLTSSNTCGCKFCSPVKIFLSSATSKKQTFLLTEHKKEHVTSNFKPSPTCPIAFQVMTSGTKYNVTVVKTDKVISDHQNFRAYLRTGKDKVMKLIQDLLAAEGEGNPPPSKVQKR